MSKNQAIITKVIFAKEKLFLAVPSSLEFNLGSCEPSLPASNFMHQHFVKLIHVLDTVIISSLGNEQLALKITQAYIIGYTVPHGY